MTLKLSPQYIGFYLEGRGAGAKAFDPPIDLDLVAKRILSQGTLPHQALFVFVTDAAKSLEVGHDRQEWIDGRRRKLDGLDADLAYSHYLQGLIDDCVAELELDEEDGIVPAIRAAASEDDDGEDDDGEDDDGEEDDEDEDEEEDDGKRRRRQ